MKLTYERFDYGHGTRIAADNGEPGMARIRLLLDLPDETTPEKAVSLLRGFAAQIEQRMVVVPLTTIDVLKARMDAAGMRQIDLGVGEK